MQREGVVAHDLEAVYITSQDSMPVQSTPDGDSIDLPTINRGVLSVKWVKDFKQVI